MTSNGDPAESLLTGPASLFRQAWPDEHRGARLAIFASRPRSSRRAFGVEWCGAREWAASARSISRGPNPIRRAAIGVPPTVGGYQVPLTQPPLTVPPPAAKHERVVAPPLRMIENVLPSVEAAVIV